MKHFNLAIKKIANYDRLLSQSKSQQVSVNDLINIFIEVGLEKDERERDEQINRAS